MGPRSRSRRGIVCACALALLGPLTAAAPSSADVLLEETFTGATANAQMRVGGTFVPCLTASTATGQENVPGCAAGQPSIPSGGDPVGGGALRLTDNAHDHHGFAIYDRLFPSTQGVRFTFTTFAYNGTRVPGYNAGDGISVFLADGSVGAQHPGAFGGSLGYAQKARDFDAEVPDIPGVPGGYVGVGVDEFGNFANDREARGYGCERRVDRDIHPDHLSIRGRGLPGSGWLRGYCLLERSPAPAPGALSQPDATSRELPEVGHTFRVEVDPPLLPDGARDPAARVRLFADMDRDGTFVPVLDVPLPDDPPSTYEFGIAASTGNATNIHEIRAVRIETIDPLPQFTLVKHHTGQLVAGSTGAFTLQVGVTRAGGPAYETLHLDDTLPPGVTLSALPSGRGWDCTASVVGSRIVHCDHPVARGNPIAPGTSLPHVTVPVAIDPGARGRRVNVARLRSLELPEPLRAPDPFTLARSVDMRIEKRAVPAVVAPGGETTYTLVAVNDGPSDADDVVVTDRAPDGVTFTGARPSQGACTHTATTLRCELDRVRADASAQVVVSAVVGADTAGRRLTNLARVTAPDDRDPSDDTATATVEVHAEPLGPLPRLRVTKTAAQRSVRIGQPVDYTIRVHNDGTVTARDVVLTDSVSMPGRLVEVRPPAGDSCEHERAVLRCRLGPIAPGATVTIRARLRFGRAGTAVDSVSVSPSVGPLADRLASAEVVVHGGARLALRKRASATRVRVGDLVRYRLTVRSLGPRPAVGVRVCDRLPAALRLVGAHGPGRRAVAERAGRQRVCWRLLGLAVGASRRYTLLTRAVRPVRRARNVAGAAARNAAPQRARRPLTVRRAPRPSVTG